MLDELREQFAHYLARHNTCIITTSGTGGAWAMPVRCRADGLHVTCLIPRWADVAHFLEKQSRVMLIMPDPGPTLCWLQVNGRAFLREIHSHEMYNIGFGNLSHGFWPASHQLEALFVAVEVVPERIDRLDESQGWGHRETLEI